MRVLTAAERREKLCAPGQIPPWHSPAHGVESRLKSTLYEEGKDGEGGALSAFGRDFLGRVLGQERPSSSGNRRLLRSLRNGKPG